MCKILRFLMCCCGTSKKMVKNSRRKKDNRSEFTTKTTDTIWDTLKGRAYSELPTNVKDITKVVTIEQTVDAINATKDDLTEYYKFVLNTQNFECLGVLGKGGYGIVFKVKKVNNEDKEVYAAKAMILGPKKFDKKFETFKRELYLMKNINHKNIIGLREHFICNQLVSFMILELATEGSLKGLMLKNKMSPMNETKAKVYFIQMVSGLTCLHKKGFYHADFKLDNLLLTIDSHGKEVVKVSDFGTTQVYYNKDNDNILPKARGTVAYMAPEAVHHYVQTKYKNSKLFKKKVKGFNPQRADMWSLGYCFYELLCGRRPFNYTTNTPEELFDMWTLMKKAKKGVPIAGPIRKRLTNECIAVLDGLICFPTKLRLDNESLGSLPYVKESEYYLVSE